MKKIFLSELINLIEAKTINFAKDIEIENGYCGDFLSYVISRVPENAVWFTVINNVNVAGVAKMGEISAIVICEKNCADERLVECCRNENINLFETTLTSFECACRLGGI